MENVRKYIRRVLEESSELNLQEDSIIPKEEDDSELEKETEDEVQTENSDMPAGKKLGTIVNQH